jgi:hypothetical protein
MLNLISVIIVAILRSAQKYRSYIKSLIAARKQKKRKSNKKNTSEVHTLRFPYVHITSFMFLSYLFLELQFNTETHTHSLLFK